MALGRLAADAKGAGRGASAHRHQVASQRKAAMTALFCARARQECIAARIGRPNVGAQSCRCRLCWQTCMPVGGHPRDLCLQGQVAKLFLPHCTPSRSASCRLVLRGCCTCRHCVAGCCSQQSAAGSQSRLGFCPMLLEVAILADCKPCWSCVRLPRQPRWLHLAANTAHSQRQQPEAHMFAQPLRPHMLVRQSLSRYLGCAGMLPRFQ